MASKVQLCNRALARLGASRITSLTDGTTEASLCNLIFNDMADEVMVEGSWSSTINRQALNLTTNTPAFGFTNEFQLPTEPFLLKVLSINEFLPGSEVFRIEGNKLLANISTMSVVYIGRVSDTQSYDTHLARAIITRLTAELAYPITGQQRVADAWWDKYSEDVSRGLALDGQQGSNDFTVSSDLIEVR